MRTRFAAVLLTWVGLSGVLARAQEPPHASGDPELKAHLHALKRQADDPQTDTGTRERLTLEMAAALDRAAAVAPTAPARRALWTEAVEALDQVSDKFPKRPESRPLQVQAAVYVWARARTWAQAFEVNPNDAGARKHAVEDLNDCVRRLTPLHEATRNAPDVLAQNVAFRLAQALSDLSEVEPGDAATLRARDNEALGALARPISEPALQGFAHLVRAALLTRLARPAEAEAEVTAAGKVKPAPPEAEQVDARLTVLLGKGDFAAAIKAVDQSGLDPGLKNARRARVRLAERLARAKSPERTAAELALFDELKALRAAGRPETLAALIAAARAIREPGPGLPPDAYDLLADGAAALGEPARAGALDRQGAERAAANGRPAQAADYRLRAAAHFFQAERFDEADPLLTRVAEDPNAGSLRAKAGLLRALARGRALALGRPGASAAGYSAALRYQVATFPADPSAAEARWLLGKLRLSESDRKGAGELWAAIPHGAPRWLDSRVELAALRQADLDAQRLNNDRDALKQKTTEARAALAACLRDASGDFETNEILLASARLELTPGVGRPDEVIRSLDRIERSAASPAQRDAARRLHLVALAQLNRWVEAEQEARQEARTTPPADLLPVVRMLDRTAAEAESDLRARRTGALLRILLGRVIDQPDTLPPGLRSEGRLRAVRALLFSGDDRGARRAVVGWSALPSAPGVDLLRDMAETYTLLEAYELAADVQRLRAKKAPTGSLDWFDARYGLALAYYRAGKPKDALHLIEATGILHPDLGGGELRDKFIRLRQRIQPTD